MKVQNSWCLKIEKRLGTLEGEVKVLLTLNIISLLSLIVLIISLRR